MQAKDRLILALDVDTMAQAEALAEKLHDLVGVFKIGMQLFNSEGPEVVRRIQARGGKVFADLKFHDIPNTVAQAGKVMTGHGVFMYNVHTSGGRKMMAEAVAATANKASEMGITKPLVIGVTVLTSMDQAILTEEIGIDRPVEEQVVKWAKLAQEAGLDGVVASPKEVAAIRQACGKDFVLVIPGIRPAWAAANDQKRIMTPREAIAAGATYIVVGRPITHAPDPREAAEKIVAEIEEGLRDVK